MYSPLINFSLYSRGLRSVKEKLKYFYTVSFMLLLAVCGNVSLNAQELEEELRETPAYTAQSAERDIQIGGGASSGAGQQGGVSAFTVLRMLLVLALAAAAIYGVVFFLKRISKPPEQKDPFVKVLAKVHLGSNRFVHVVSVGSRAWLLGASEGGVSVISEITDEEIINAMLLDASRRGADSGKIPDFANILSRLSGGGTPTTPNINADNVRKRRERLRGL